ncbi:MAG: VanZ family protein [Ruminiclostridium sp.]|nr:VanZ family protein [Ruminiclostridium sp.]
MNSVKKKIPKMILLICFAVYAAIMLYLLFFQRVGRDDVPLSERFQLIPFRTVAEYVNDILTLAPDDNGSLPALINIGGNIVLFIPLGLFIPALFTKLRSFSGTVIAVVITILCVELIQAFTLLGACDIDDLILNTAGACIGYGIFAALRQHERTK